MVRPILITGFGPFLDVRDNPSGALALAVDGAVVRGVPIVGRVLPVSYARAPVLTAEYANELQVRAVIGMGVSRSAPSVRVERTGRRQCTASPDADGVVLADLGEGPDHRVATLDAERLAAALGVMTSDDAGGYVCNAWLYRVVDLIDVPAVFLHLPTSGLNADRLLAAVHELLAEGELDA